MPIYEYSCAKCKKTIEVIQKMSDNSLRTHSGCGGKLTKLISRSAFQLKGTGWYVTDYGSKSKGEGSESAKNESSEGKDASKASDTSSAKKEDDSKSTASSSDATPTKSEKTSARTTAKGGEGKSKKS